MADPEAEDLEADRAAAVSEAEEVPADRSAADLEDRTEADRSAVDRTDRWVPGADRQDRPARGDGVAGGTTAGASRGAVAVASR